MSNGCATSVSIPIGLRMQFDDYTLSLNRICQQCSTEYTIGDAWDGNDLYFSQPYDYYSGCQKYCLNCWLINPPCDTPIDAFESELSPPPNAIGANEFEQWPYNAIYESLCKGNLIKTYEWFLDRGCCL